MPARRTLPLIMHIDVLVSGRKDVCSVKGKFFFLSLGTRVVAGCAA